MSLEAGIAETLKKKDFEKFENGFVTLKTKKCTFGIEMFQIESKPTTTNLSLIKNLYSHWHSCTFDSFSKLEQKDGSSQSDEFQIGDYYWYMFLLPISILMYFYFVNCHCNLDYMEMQRFQNDSNIWEM